MEISLDNHPLSPRISFLHGHSTWNPLSEMLSLRLKSRHSSLYLASLKNAYEAGRGNRASHLDEVGVEAGESTR